MDRNKALAAILVVTIVVCSGSAAQAHKPLLSVADNEDGTIYIEAGFSDGGSAAGHKIILKDEKTEAVISEHRVGEDGTLDLKKPSVPYTVTLDAGVGHVVTKPGPPPSEAKQNADSEKPEAKPSEAASEPKKTEAAPPASKVTRAAAAPRSSVPAVQPIAQAASLHISPGVMMAFKMMITAQIVTATALIILLAAIAYFFGYTMGKRSGAAHHE